MERTFCMIKPDGVQRRLVGKILQRFEEKGLRIAALKIVRLERAMAENLYSVHKGKPFYDGLVNFVTSGPVVALAIEGYRSIEIVRKLLGATFSYTAEPGTIRGDYGSSKGYNLVHGSDSEESVRREIPIFFTEKDLVAYKHADFEWVYEAPERS